MRNNRTNLQNPMNQYRALKQALQPHLGTEMTARMQTSRAQLVVIVQGQLETIRAIATNRAIAKPPTEIDIC